MNKVTEQFLDEEEENSSEVQLHKQHLWGGVGYATGL